MRAVAVPGADLEMGLRLAAGQALGRRDRERPVLRWTRSRNERPTSSPSLQPRSAVQAGLRLRRWPSGVAMQNRSVEACQIWSRSAVRCATCASSEALRTRSASSMRLRSEMSLKNTATFARAGRRPAGPARRTSGRTRRPGSRNAPAGRSAPRRHRCRTSAARGRGRTRSPTGPPRRPRSGGRRRGWPRRSGNRPPAPRRRTSSRECRIRHRCSPAGCGSVPRCRGAPPASGPAR